MANQKFFKAPRYLLRKHNILKILRSKKEISNFIDVGCGAGELACTLAQEGYAGIGVDFSDDAMETAQSIKHERGIKDEQLKFIKGSPQDINEKYDLVISCEVLEHVEDDAGLLANLRDLSNNYILISVPARMKYFDQFDVKVGHYRRYEKDQLKQLFEDAKLDIEEFHCYGYPFVNLTRLIRKASAGKVKHQANMEDYTKKSGVNPIKMSESINNIDIERFMKLLFYLSLPFNRFNLSEAYLVLARKKERD